MTTDHVYNLIILDESGSMESIKNPTMNGFNEVVQTIRGVELQFPEQKHYISLVSFNTFGIRTLLDRQPVRELREINAATYNPNAGTPLYDAICLSVLKLRMDIAGQQNANVLVTILTDGEENSSKEFNGRQVKQIIEEQKALGWTFTYIGTDHDVERVAASMSISNSMSFEKNQADMAEMFVKEHNARIRFSQNIHDKKDPRENYYDEDKQ
jgi:hypothetical protein